MRRFLVIVALLLGAIGFAPRGFASKVYTPRTVPNVQVEDYRHFVTNPDGILSEGAVYSIDTMLLRLKQQRIAEVAVVAVESIGFAEPREFATELFRYWGIGEKGRDNGLLVLLVLGQGAIEIEVGYGLEGTLTDALCKRIIERAMIPHFKQSNFDEGMLEGVGSIGSILSTSEIPADLAPSASEGDEDVVGVCIALGTFLLFILMIVVLLRLNSRCPKCKKQGLRRSPERIEIEKNAYQTVYKVAWKCPHCGHTLWRKEADNNSSRGGGGGPIIMGGGGFGRGGGSFGGGFGGGFSGGGGAGGRF